jgi:hypothetical protein
MLVSEEVGNNREYHHPRRIQLEEIEYREGGALGDEG